MSRLESTTILVLAALLLPLSGSVEQVQHDGLDAALWLQTSSERRALALQCWNAAQDRLAVLREDGWSTAALEQAAQGEGFHQVKPAIIVDIDETVLDNSPYQARLILDGASYTDETWDAWVEQACAEPVPGALRFLQSAAEEGVRVFYVSNRKAHLEEATRRNLARFGFPLLEEPDCVMLKGEQEDWTSNKASRRRKIAEDHRIVMIVGDDMGDFFPAAKTGLKDRAVVTAEFAERFGREWFVLPNPTYGSWKEALVDFRRDLDGAARRKLLLSRLDPKRESR